MPQKKIDFFGQFRPTGVDNSAAQRIRALAGVSQQVGALAFEEGKKQRIKEGRQEGVQSVERDEEGNVIAPELRGDYTFKDQAYNEAAILAHRAEVSRDTKETLNRLQNEHELGPQAFREVAAKYKEGVLQGMPEDLKFVLSEDIENEIVTRGTQLDDKFFEFQKSKAIAAVEEQAADLKDDILNAARIGDEEQLERARAKRLALLDRGVQNGYIDPSSAKKDAESILEGVTFNRELGRLERLFEDPDLLLSEKITKATDIVDAQKNKVYKDLSPDQRDALNNALQSELNQQLKKEAEMNAQTQKELAFETVQLKLDAQYGRQPPAKIASKAYDMFRSQEISEAEYQGILNDLAAVEQKQTAIALVDDKVSRRLQGDESIALSKKEVDSYYERNIVPLLKQLPSSERAAYTANFARYVGIVPTQLGRQITNNLRSQDQELITEAAETIDAIDNIRGLESPVSPHDRAFAQQVLDLSGVMESEMALKIAREQTDPQNKDRIEARERIIKDEEYDDSYQEEAINLFDDDDIDSISAGQLEKEYKTIFEAHFKAGMDEDAAREKAEQILTKNWQYSPSSERMMKYPPEQYYAIQGDASYVKDQLNDWVRENTSFGITTEGYEKAFLASDEQTGELASMGQPDYLVYVQDNNGMLNLVTAQDPKDGKIKVVRWSPDKKAQKEKIKSMNADEVMKMRLDNLNKRSLQNMPVDVLGQGL